jgi:hypothetical protein
MNEMINYVAQQANDRTNPRLAMKYSGIYSKILEIQVVGKGLDRVKEFLTDMIDPENNAVGSNGYIAATDVLNKFFS